MSDKPTSNTEITGDGNIAHGDHNVINVDKRTTDTRVDGSGNVVGDLNTIIQQFINLDFYGALLTWHNHWSFWPSIILSLLLLLLFLVSIITIAGANIPGAASQCRRWGICATLTPTPTPTSTSTPTPTPTSTPTPLPFPPQTENEVLILLHDFYRTQGIKDVGIATKIQRTLSDMSVTTLSTLPAMSAEPATTPDHPEEGQLVMPYIRSEHLGIALTADDKDLAEYYSEIFNATISIWGEDSGIEIIVNFLNIGMQNTMFSEVEIIEDVAVQIVNPEAYKEFVLTELPDQITFLTLFALAQIQIVEGNYTQAVDILEQTVLLPIEQVEGMAEAYYLLGWLYQQNFHDPDRAEIYYRKGLELNSNSPKILNNLGLISYQKKDFKNAEELFSQAIQLAPELTAPYVNKGALALSLGNDSEASFMFSKVKNIDPLNSALLWNQALVQGPTPSPTPIGTPVPDFRPLIDPELITGIIAAIGIVIFPWLYKLTLQIVLGFPIIQTKFRDLPKAINILTITTPRTTNSTVKIGRYITTLQSAHRITNIENDNDVRIDSKYKLFILMPSSARAHRIAKRYNADLVIWPNRKLQTLHYQSSDKYGVRSGIVEIDLQDPYTYSKLIQVIRAIWSEKEPYK